METIKPLERRGLAVVADQQGILEVHEIFEVLGSSIPGEITTKVDDTGTIIRLPDNQIHWERDLRN